MNVSKRLLAIYAHPDDEAFTAGGTFATFTDRGGQITLVCATRGEAGGISDPTLATRGTLGTVREAELRTAMRSLGVTDIRFLNYRDSGMEGSSDNNHPRAFRNADERAVVEQLREVMREVRPDFVFSFGEDGIYGHPDHIKAHHVATAAVASYTMERDGNGPALYFNSVPRQQIVEEMSKRTTGPYVGKTPEELAKFGTPEDQITTKIDVSAQLDRKLAALLAHRTQFGTGGPLSDLPVERRRELMSTERFRLEVNPSQVRDPLLDYFGQLGTD